MKVFFSNVSRHAGPTLFAVGLLVLIVAPGPLLLVGCEATSAAPSDAAADAQGAVPAGIVSSAHELASAAGVSILEGGGNAFDAAVAVAATLTVVEPMNSNLIGGYGTIVLWDNDSKEVRYLDMNGRFPKRVDASVLRAIEDTNQRERGAPAVSTPGNLHGFETLWKEYGTREWADLLAPAIAHAERGYEIDARVADAIEGAWKYFPEHAQTIFGRDGSPLESGDRLTQVDLAASLRQVAAEGASAVYGGTLGAAIEKEVAARGGFLELADLVAHDSDWLPPISIDYRGVEVYTAGAPSNSFAALVALGIMSRFDLAAGAASDADYWHRFAEATKHAFAARLEHAGGPEVDPPPFDTLLSESYWQAQASSIDLAKASEFVPPAALASEGESTTHFVVADSFGNVVSATITLGHGFGSGVMVEGKGIWLNNSLAYCTFEPPGNPMDALPGARKHSSKSPMLLVLRNPEIGQYPWIAIGTPGGHTIPQTMAQLVIDLVDFDMELEETLLLPRVAFAEPDRLIVETGLDDALVTELEARGHHVVRRGIGLAHALELVVDESGRPMRFEGAADPRGFGAVAVAAPR